jgi:hypothetical protein
MRNRGLQISAYVGSDVFPELPHGLPLSSPGHAPEADDAIPELTGWVRPKLDFPEKVFV